MISTLFPSTKPVIAAASPVNELSSEMMTGMSAPPIGSTNSTPRSSAPPNATKYIGSGTTLQIDEHGGRDDR